MINTVGFIGLGLLGSAIARNFVAGDVRVLAFDISPTACAEAEEYGVEIVDSASAITEAASMVFTCLPSFEALEQAMLGPQGLLQSEAPGQIVVEMSTLTLADKNRFAEACRNAGRHPVDCPVSGNRIVALRKKLTAFFSGDEADYALVKPVLALTCSKTHFVGPFGDGSKIKFCGNILNLVHNSVAAEAMVLAIKSGIDPKLFYDVISGSGSGSAMFDVRGALMVEEDYQKEGMNMSVPLKDARIISEHAAELFCPLPIYQVALQNYYAAAAQGYDKHDAAIVCKIMENSARAHRGGDADDEENDPRGDEDRQT